MLLWKQHNNGMRQFLPKNWSRASNCTTQLQYKMCNYRVHFLNWNSTFPSLYLPNVAPEHALLSTLFLCMTFTRPPLMKTSKFEAVNDQKCSHWTSQIILVCKWQIRWVFLWKVLGAMKVLHFQKSLKEHHNFKKMIIVSAKFTDHAKKLLTLHHSLIKPPSSRSILVLSTSLFKQRCPKYCREAHQ